MSKLFLKTLLLILLGAKISFAQELPNYEKDYNRNPGIKLEGVKETQYNDSVQYSDKNNPTVDNKNTNPVFNNRNEQIYINSDDKIPYSTPQNLQQAPQASQTPQASQATQVTQASPINPKKSKKSIKNDGMGVGFRVYDNSNRQSYFCGLNQVAKPKFSHDNNFNGVYFGVAVNSISSTVDFSLKNANGSNIIIVNGKPFDAGSSSFSQSFSGNNVLPSILLGQGRLFSNGLFLGQEASINIGEFSASKKNTQFENVNFDEIKMFSSNFSSYSGKFGYNIFRNFLPYVKASISLSPMKYLIKVNNENSSIDRSRYLAVGGLPNFGIGAGMDISLYDHVRMMIDYTYFSAPNGEFDATICTKEPCNNSQEKRPEMNSSFSIAKVGIVWRF
jgi:hypothetical protein